MQEHLMDTDYTYFCGINVDLIDLTGLNATGL